MDSQKFLRMFLYSLTVSLSAVQGNAEIYYENSAALNRCTRETTKAPQESPPKESSSQEEMEEAETEKKGDPLDKGDRKMIEQENDQNFDFW